MKKIAKNKGFTLIEILVVIGIIALLAAIVIIAINPARQFAQARNSQRVSNLNTILNAMGQNMADNKGIWNCGVYFSATRAEIGTASKNIASCLTNYIASGIPMDPSGGTAANTKYWVSTSTTGIITICAPESVESALGSPAEICVSR